MLNDNDGYAGPPGQGPGQAPGLMSGGQWRLGLLSHGPSSSGVKSDSDTQAEPGPPSRSPSGVWSAAQTLTWRYFHCFNAESEWRGPNATVSSRSPSQRRLLKQWSNARSNARVCTTFELHLYENNIDYMYFCRRFGPRTKPGGTFIDSTRSPTVSSRSPSGVCC